MSLFNSMPSTSPRKATVYIWIAESVEDNRREELEKKLSRMSSFRQTRLHVSGANQALFEATPEDAITLFASLPPDERGLLITQVGHQVRTRIESRQAKEDLCPAT